MRIAIIGAGAAGLAAAYDLAKAGHSVTVFESGPEVGGLAAGFKDIRWDWTLEKFYHHWFATDHDILQLLSEIGCADRVRFYSPTTSYWHESGNFALDKPVLPSGLLSRIVNVLRIPSMSLIDRLRMGLVSGVVAFIPNGLFLEKYTANDWAYRWMGRAAHERFWKPMLIGKFGPLYDQVNMAWFWARMNKRTAKLGTYVGGFQEALNDIAAAAWKLGVTINLNAYIGQITSVEGSELRVATKKVGGYFDQVLSTTSPAAMLKLTPDLPDPYASKLRNLHSIGAQCLILALDRQLMTDGTYWLNLPAAGPDKDENTFPFLALVEHTNYLSKEYYGGDHLVYLGDYLSPEHAYFRMSEEELAARYLPALKRVNPGFSPEWIRKRWLFRSPYAQPVPFVNHSQHLPDIRTPMEGLYFASMSQVYPWDRGTNYAVEMGRRAARMMLEDAAKTAEPHEVKQNPGRSICRPGRAGKEIRTPDI
ncbi:MAG: NAD(P)/FAD-dependent oxidoreductase [Anaerolineae bacterium]|nr:NAD(P)/FAD-dependent oxidoreductase [Anaerolineae bacterium]